ncbi:unnamed protein product [Rotaria sp. Silwood1]|nr:unnamed protein product [Rotaria sp. Silwood1]
MACRLSLYTCWFPRTLLCQKFFLRASFSTIPKPDTISQSHRSASRFSVKIARFLFSKERLKQSASLSTHAHYTKTESSGDIHELARSFILSLEPEHRRILSNELIQVEKLSSETINTIPILYSQLTFGKRNLIIYF